MPRWADRLLPNITIEPPHTATQAARPATVGEPATETE